MAKKKKNHPQNEQQKKKSNVADAAFKKKVTIINGCILLAFIIGLIAFLCYTMVQEDSYPERFQSEIDAAKEAALDKNSDKSVIDINVTDETFVDWILALGASYGEHYHTHNKDGEIEKIEESDNAITHECFEGNTIKLKGVFKIIPLGGIDEYWVSRKFLDVNGGENTVSIAVNFDGDIPEDGSWVEVVGIVTSENGLSCIDDAKITVLDIKDKKEFVK